MELVEVRLVEVSEGKADMADVAVAVVVGWLEFFWVCESLWCVNVLVVCTSTQVG